MSESTSSTGPGFRIGDYRLHLPTRELLHAGEPVELQPKVFDFIAFLVQNRERAVDKNELLDAVWPHQVVTETALTRCVMKARRAFGDDAEAQRVIRTVHGRGYRFVAEVEPVETMPAVASVAVVPVAGEAVDAHVDQGSVADLAAEPPRPVPAASPALSTTAAGTGRGRVWRRWIALAVATLGVALPTLWIGWPMQPRLEASTAARARIAILPVRNATGEPRYDWVRLGLAAATVDFLQQTRVGSVSPSDVLRLLEALGLDGTLDEATQAEAARALWQAHGATHTLVPVLEAGTGNLRLSYRLLDRDGRVRRRILVAPDAARLARSLGADLSVQFGGERAQREAIDDGFVSEAYLRARALAMTGDYETAMPLLEAAIGLAPEAFWPRYEYALILRNRREFDLAEPLLRTLIEQAHAREDAVAEEYALNSLAILRWQREDLDEAESLYGRALALAEVRGDQPAIGKILQNASVISRIRRDFARSREQLLAALAAYTRAGFEHPPPPLFMALGNQAEQEGDFVGAEQHYLRSEAGYRALGGGNAVAAAIYNRARLQFQLGRFEAAGALLDDAASQYREHKDLRGLVGALNARAELELLRERPAAAESFARDAVAQADALPHDIPRAYTRKTLGRCLAAAGRIGDADEVYGHAQAYYRSGRLEEGWQETEILRAGLRLAQGDWRGARERAESVRQQAARDGLERPQAEAESLLAQAAHRAGDRETMRTQWDAALQRLEQALPGEALRLAEHRLLAAQDWLDVGDAAEAGRLLALAEPILGKTPRWQAARARLQTAD